MQPAANGRTKRKMGTVPQHLIVTGASGFLGSALTSLARVIYPKWKITALNSPRQGGPDLAGRNCLARFREELPVGDPGNTVLIHAAAEVLDGPMASGANAKMAGQVAAWAESAEIGFCVLVSS